MTHSIHSVKLSIALSIAERATIAQCHSEPFGPELTVEGEFEL